MRKQTNRRWTLALGAWGLLAVAGCSDQVIELPGTAQAQPGVAAPAAPRAGSPTAPPPPQPAAPIPRKQEPRLPDVPAVLGSDPDEKGPDAFGPEGPPPLVNREEATAGVGAKGRGYGGGLVTEPIHQHFTVQQRLVFSVQIPKALQLYKAEHNNQAPKTHADFIRDIIAANSIILPELPEGDRYVYDPKLEKLMVEHPSPKQTK
jgi:hypothetical protein